MKNPIIITVKTLNFISRFKEIEVKSLVEDFYDLKEITAALKKLEKLAEEHGGIVVIFPNTNGLLWDELIKKSHFSVSV